jgi:hypothetical protein
VIVIAKGSLKLGYTKAQGLFAYDGLDCFKILSPYLLQKWLKHGKKIPVFLAGQWVVVGNFIIAFKRDKKIIHRHISLNEKYNRKDIR